MIRVLEEVLALGDKGILLFTDSEDVRLQPGITLVDARGNRHPIAKIDHQEELTTLLIAGGDPAYFERLFRDVRVDATAFEIAEEN